MKQNRLIRRCPPSRTPSAHSVDSVDGLLGEVAEEFFDRVVRGENPDIEQYVQQHPQFSKYLRDVFPALELIKKSTDNTAQCFGNRTHPEIKIAGCSGMSVSRVSVGPDRQVVNLCVTQRKQHVFEVGIELAVDLTEALEL
jgi:hypothetical protein